MRDLNKLRIKYKEVDVNGIMLKVHGLTYEELTIFADYLDKRQSKEGLRYLLESTLKKDVTEEELKQAGLTMDEFISSISSECAAKIINAVKDLSGIETGEKN